MVVVALGVAGCGRSTAAGFCATMREPRSGFSALDAEPSRASIDAFADLTAEVPSELRADFQAVGRIARARAEPGRVPTPDDIDRFFAATARIDRALEQRCGIRVRGAPNLFERLDPGQASAKGAAP